MRTDGRTLVIQPTTPASAPAAIVALLSIGLAAIHLVAGRLRFLEAIPRSRWLSAAGGISVAYVFVHVLPEVGAAGETIDRSASPIAAVEHHVYLVALVGFTVFFGLERFVRSRTRERGAERGGRGVFWVHVWSFAGYNAIVGYLLVHREEPGRSSLVLYAVAMGVHFVVNDFGLRAHHGRVYDRAGRWVLAGAVLVGTAVGLATRVDDLLVAVPFAFLAGGVILNVMKEELPAERRSRFGAFAVGAAGYTAVLLAT